MMRAAEKRLDLLRARVGGDIEIFRLDAQQKVAHRATDDVGRETGFTQHVAHLRCRGADRLAREPVLIARHAIDVIGREPEDPPDEPLDHSRAAILPA